MGVECLQLKTVNLQAFQEDKASGREVWGVEGGPGQSSPSGQDLGVGRGRSCADREVGYMERWALGLQLFPVLSEI